MKRLRDIPIKRKLMNFNLVIISIVVLLICATFFTYEYFSFRDRTIEKVRTLANITARNSTAALAFSDLENAREILTALNAEKHIVAAALYSGDSTLFATYPNEQKVNSFPITISQEGFLFGYSFIDGFMPVREGNRILGSLYLKYDLSAMYDRFKVYGMFCLLVIIISFLIANLLSHIFQKNISNPILSLAGTAATISGTQDYSLRAKKFGEDEIGKLTDSFNVMLSRIQKQDSEIRNFSQSLERKVIERTAELKEANKELESFAYSVSHDLRAPLRIINGYADILTSEYKEVLDDEGKRLTGVIQSNAHYMGQLIDDLLNLSRLGRAELNLQEVDMNSLVHGIMNEYVKPEESKTRVILDDLKPAQADFNLIRQVWINLISNSVKYSSKKNDAEIRIGSTGSNGEITYFVKDNGAGFDMKYAGKLFGVFQRLHKANEFEGTGVGLAIVQRIMARHNGKVWAESEVDKGATFYFSLPVRNIN